MPATTGLGSTHTTERTEGQLNVTVTITDGCELTVELQDPVNEKAAFAWCDEVDEKTIRDVRKFLRLARKGAE